MATAVRTPELDAAILNRYVPGIFGIKRVAQEFGVGVTTVRRIIKGDEWEERLRRLSREAKQRRHGTCVLCGGETRYGGKTRSGVSDICASCNIARLAEHGRQLRGTGPNYRKLAAFIGDGQRTFTEINHHFQRPKGHTSGMLNRLVSYGLIVRVRRGIYMLP